MAQRHTIDVQELRKSRPKPRAPKDAFEEQTHRLRTTFMGEDLPPEVYDTGATWNKIRLQHVGSCEAVAYASDKWGGRPKKSFEEFKHVVEAPQELYAVRGAIGERTYGPWWKPREQGFLMPDVLAEMAPLLFVQSRLHVDEDDEGEGIMGRGADDGCVEIAPSGCLLYGGYLRTSKKDTSGEPCLVVIGYRSGVQFVITGNELDVTKDGIVG